MHLMACLEAISQLHMDRRNQLCYCLGDHSLVNVDVTNILTYNKLYVDFHNHLHTRIHPIHLYNKELQSSHDTSMPLTTLMKICKVVRNHSTSRF